MTLANQASAGLFHILIYKQSFSTLVENVFENEKDTFILGWGLGITFVEHIEAR